MIAPRLAGCWPIGVVAVAMVLPMALASALVAEPASAGEERAATAQPSAWPLWTAFVGHFLSADGRVVDHTADARSTSEGQAYALFFALVANDRANFDRILLWTQNNLAQGSLAARLPAWHWGRSTNGQWQIIDSNPASDADLWLAFTLIEAGRLWGDRGLSTLGRQIAARIAATEVAKLRHKGAVLLPAPRGFGLKDRGGWRLNPSYVPPQLATRLTALAIPGPWAAVAKSTLAGIAACSRGGFVADWIAWTRKGGYGPDPQTGTLGSYDAIRTYLWVGMNAAPGHASAELRKHLRGPLQAWRKGGHVPEKVDVASGKYLTGPGPVGFLAAIAPMVAGGGSAEELTRLLNQIEAARHNGLYGQPPSYYDQALLLFGLGYVQRRYSFAADGALQPAWVTGKR